jgi:hypothetical protein
MNIRDKMNIGERYLFHHQKKDGTMHYFRADYLGTFVFNKYTSYIVKNYEDYPYGVQNKLIGKEGSSEESGLPTIIMYGNNIIKTETLVDILQSEKCKLPDDVLFEINKFF